MMEEAIHDNVPEVSYLRHLQGVLSLINLFVRIYEI